MPLDLLSCRPKFAFNDDNFFTFSSTEQKRVEDLVLESLKEESGTVNTDGSLHKDTHIGYLLRSLKSVGASYSSLDASRTWMCFWAVHSLNLLGATIPHAVKLAIVRFLKSCEHPAGGYGGGPGQMAHLAPTYAAVMALASLQIEEALASIDLPKLSLYLHRMKRSNGGFVMHEDGEMDMRSVYCATAVAVLLGLESDNLAEGAAEWIVTCQTYEGGFGGEPGTEAHGGYAYCAVATLALLERFRLLDFDSFLRWLVRRQMRFEGGFQGRTNKLVDGCYSFWQAAVFPILDAETAHLELPETDGLFDSRMLEEYIIFSCRDKEGLRDKPDKPRDLYHTCYVLSGLSVAQHYSDKRGRILGPESNRLEEINPLFNITKTSEDFVRSYFAAKASKSA